MIPNSSIHIDANVFVYVAGRQHPAQQPSRLVLRMAAESPAFFTDAEVFQELLHRYVSLHVWDKVADQVTLFAELMAGRIEPMLPQDVALAGIMVRDYPQLAARDLVHVAIMTRLGARYIVTADRAFDTVEGIERLDPMRVEEWRSLVTG